ncbi:catalase-like domain-containing protein [Mycena rosella]|uniref:Catalase n=1 Tax=Mycena rosella TaxID=1033263 RepID=A0AAD7M9G7_MYCRO|nr:catalase-like domain-containing protein [Mycena rosella]
MSTVGGAIKQAVTSMTNTAKIADLQRNTVEVTSSTGLTTDHGVSVSDTDTWLSVSDGETGPGPALLEDHIAREKIHRFDHERIPERVVHARGTGAHGYFKAYEGSAASQFTYASVLTDSTRTTPVFVRFSTVQGSRGSPDTVRDVRGFAVKMYTEEGNWDLVGNNIPVFFIQDAIKFPDFVHAVKPEPHNEVPTGQSAHNNFWDFVGLQPESAHMVCWTMSDRAIPRSYRMMQGFGVNTYTLLNSANERFFVKFHWLPELGVHSLIWDEALKLSGQDPDFHRKDLEEAIENGAPPKWTLAIQTIAEKDEHNFEFDILDATKIWPTELVPLHEIGEMVLNRTVDEFFPETEQSAFCTSHIVPGIGFSDDPLLQGRNFSYFDTQISRLGGVNWEQLPINRPVCPVMNHNRDGQHQTQINKCPVNYWPNRLNAGAPVPAAQGGYHEFAQKVVGIKQRLRAPKFREHFNQAQLFVNSLSAPEKAHMIAAFSFELDHCDDPVVYESYTKILNNIDFDLATAVATNVGGVLPSEVARPNHGQTTFGISQLDFMPKTPTIKTRRIAILVADGFDATGVTVMKTVLKASGAVPFVIGPRRGNIRSSSGGEGVFADHHFEGQRSTMFDALYIPNGNTEFGAVLRANGRVVHWIAEAFGHCKVIAGLGEGQNTIQYALARYVPELAFGTFDSDAVVTSYGVITSGKYSLGSTATDMINIASGGDKGFVSNFAFEISKHRCFERELAGLTSKVAY